MKIYVEYNVISLGSYQSDEPYGDWWEDLDFEVKGVSIGKPARVVTEDFNINENFNIGDEVWVVYMIYSSGDSFGSSTGNGEVLWVFKTEEDAIRAKEAIKEQERNSSINFNTANGQLVKMSNPAWGYFENVSSVNIEKFVIKA